MLPRTSTTSNHSRLRSERDATAIADSMASETDLSELPTTSVFTYVRLVAICSSLWRSARDTNRPIKGVVEIGAGGRRRLLAPRPAVAKLGQARAVVRRQADRGSLPFGLARQAPAGPSAPCLGLEPGDEHDRLVRRQFLDR